MADLREEDFDFEVQGSLAEYRRFLESPIWADFKKFLADRKEFVMQDLLDLSKEGQSLFFKGELHSILHMEKLPEFFINLLEAPTDEREEEG